MIGLIVWSILILFIGWCITPWWFIPSIIVGSIIYIALFGEEKYY